MRSLKQKKRDQMEQDDIPIKRNFSRWKQLGNLQELGNLHC